MAISIYQFENSVPQFIYSSLEVSILYLESLVDSSTALSHNKRPFQTLRRVEKVRDMVYHNTRKENP